MKFRKKPVVIDAVQWDGSLSCLRSIEAALRELERDMGYTLADIKRAKALHGIA